jgi:hypothetical protein
LGTRGIDRAVCLVSLAIALLSAVAAMRWIHAHPFPIWWDEANYYNQVVDDRQAFLRGGPLAVVKSLLFADNQRPPAYRALVAPLAAVTLPSLPLLRSLAFILFMVSLALLWTACRAVASVPNALLATALVFSTPAVLASGAWFGTEYPLYLAIGLLLWSVLRDSPLGVAAAVALGLLAKASFLVIGGPVLLVAMITAANRQAARKLFLAAAGGALIAAGWWWCDPVAALQFAQLGRTFERAAFHHALTPATIMAKLRLFAEALGPGVLIAMGVAGIGAFRKREAMSPETRRAVLVGLSAAVPIILLAALSPVFVDRHFAPALFGLALPLAIFVQDTRPAIRLGLAGIVLIQAVCMAVVPMRFLPAAEQTDWSKLRTVVHGTYPRIAFMGGFPSMSPPEIRYGWTRDGSDVSVIWLWRFEERQIDWPKVMEEALRSDAVLVDPSPSALMSDSESLAGQELLDNRYSAELIERLRASGTFENPVPFRAGTHKSLELLVYLRKH